MDDGSTDEVSSVVDEYAPEVDDDASEDEEELASVVEELSVDEENSETFSVVVDELDELELTDSFRTTSMIVVSSIVASEVGAALSSAFDASVVDEFSVDDELEDDGSSVVDDVLVDEISSVVDDAGEDDSLDELSTAVSVVDEASCWRRDNSLISTPPKVVLDGATVVDVVDELSEEASDSLSAVVDEWIASSSSLVKLCDRDSCKL